MTRKNYIAFAKALAKVKPVPEQGILAHSLWVDTVYVIADVLDADNPRFDFNRFREACNAKL